MTFIAAVVIGGVCVFLIPTLFVISYSHNDSVALLAKLFLLPRVVSLRYLPYGEPAVKTIRNICGRFTPSGAAGMLQPAVEQLADDKAPIRLGGVYTLVKLVDEWLADEKTISKEGERREEGQVIIIQPVCLYPLTFWPCFKNKSAV
ncbi:hypothetical protein CRM92_05600 [Rothia dentocariosa]|uniref:Uncharacterized protein n=1 Tax=Rothia dentocariosa TaxID=2047 RepID=A0A2A8D5V1_9MICC|nr:hypothetical protein [Rothia dentocariosa]PEN16167.1 hypothetical protein CRM92_05600 [Rothia dentocariosa]